MSDASSPTFHPPTHQVDGGLDMYIAGKQYEVNKLVALRIVNFKVQYLVNWEGFNQTHDSWEPEGSIALELKEAFHDVRDITIDSTQVDMDISHEVGQALLKLRRAEGEFSVSIRTASLPPVAHAQLARAAHPPSRNGMEPLKVEVDVGDTRMTTQVQLDNFEDAGAWLQLQVAYPGQMFGCGVLKKGRGSAHDMIFFGFPLVVGCVAPAACLVACASHCPGMLRFTEPLPRGDGAYVPGPREFKIEGNVYGMNGATGRMKGVLGGQNKSARHPLAEYAKNILRGRARHGLKVRLTKEWAQLPKGELELAITKALPRHDVRKVRAGPQSSSAPAPTMGALVYDSSDDDI